MLAILCCYFVVFSYDSPISLFLVTFYSICAFCRICYKEDEYSHEHITHLTPESRAVFLTEQILNWLLVYSFCVSSPEWHAA